MIQVHQSGRYLVRDGQPFFYLADTGWELLHRLSPEETLTYLQQRAMQGFTVIQTVILAELDGLREPTPQGHLPLQNLDPSRLSEDYFSHVDWVVERARELGLVLALLPTWGDKWNLMWGAGPEIFNPENAEAYGRALGERYADRANIIWVLGGDRPFLTPLHEEIVRRMAGGLRAGGAGQLQTLHPGGGRGSSQTFPDAPWLDFHMWQTGHDRNSRNWEKISADYQRTPVKPVLDGEPGYEEHKAGFQLENGYLDDYDCRKALYWSLFSGACGHTYGCHAVWQFWSKNHQPVNQPRRQWFESLQLPGASQMHYARQLHDWKPFLGAIPAAELVAEQPQKPDQSEDASQHIASLRSEDGSFALFYFPANATITLGAGVLCTAGGRANWWDPRTGLVECSEEIAEVAGHTVTPPGWGPDWVLVLESV